MSREGYLIWEWLDDLAKIHPLTLPITFGMDVELLPHAKVSSDRSGLPNMCNKSVFAPEKCKVKPP